MTDTVSWTEPLESARERWYLGNECDGGWGEVREAAYMSEASRVPIREERCAHYGRGGRRGQRERAGRAGSAKAWRRFAMRRGDVSTGLRVHGGGRGCARSASRVPPPPPGTPHACVPTCREQPNRHPSACATRSSPSPRQNVREHSRNQTLTRHARSPLHALQLTSVRFASPDSEAQSTTAKRFSSTRLTLHEASTTYVPSHCEIAPLPHPPPRIPEHPHPRRILPRPVRRPGHLHRPEQALRMFHEDGEPSIGRRQRGNAFG